MRKADEIDKKANATQAEVDAAKSELEKAIRELDGRETNKAELKKQMQNANAAKPTHKYYNGSEDKKNKLEEAFRKHTMAAER